MRHRRRRLQSFIYRANRCAERLVDETGYLIDKQAGIQVAGVNVGASEAPVLRHQPDDHYPFVLARGVNTLHRCNAQALNRPKTLLLSWIEVLSEPFAERFAFGVRFVGRDFRHFKVTTSPAAILRWTGIGTCQTDRMFEMQVRRRIFSTTTSAASYRRNRIGK